MIWIILAILFILFFPVWVDLLFSAFNGLLSLLKLTPVILMLPLLAIPYVIFIFCLPLTPFILIGYGVAQKCGWIRE